MAPDLSVVSLDRRQDSYLAFTSVTTGNSSDEEEFKFNTDTLTGTAHYF